MRKIALMVLAGALLASASPVLAQPGSPGYGDRRHDSRGADREFERWRGDFQRELMQLKRRVNEDYGRRLINKRQARGFNDRIEELQRTERRERDRNGGFLRPDQRRFMDAAIDRVRTDLRLNEERNGRGRY
ncbi:MAG TPA: hypothetical protein VFN88_07910 [Caulobacteraceae bacterium]|nr:hypothetical protein [Caulobacteraceae bacterium]